MQLVEFFSSFLPQHIAYAHCDIPCGIYDPHTAQMAAHTVLRMTQLLTEVKRDDETKAEHDIVRITRVKEKHGALVEEELGTLENDYFKPEHFSQYSNLKELFGKGVKLSAKTRQTIDKAAAEELLETVMQLAEIFYQSKKLEPVRVASGYPTGGQIVSHK